MTKAVIALLVGLSLMASACSTDSRERTTTSPSKESSTSITHVLPTGSVTTTGATTSTSAPERDAAIVARERFEARLEVDSQRIVPAVEKTRVVELEAIAGLRDAETLTYSPQFIGLDRYDIRHTDSIIRPFVGQADFAIEWYFNGDFIEIQYIEATYEYIDGQWIFVEARRRFAGGSYTSAQEPWFSEMFLASLLADSADRRLICDLAADSDTGSDFLGDHGQAIMSELDLSFDQWYRVLLEIECTVAGQPIIEDALTLFGNAEGE